MSNDNPLPSSRVEPFPSGWRDGPEDHINRPRDAGYGPTDPLRPPYLLADAWRDYIHERCRRLGQDIPRVCYVARHWLRIMGPEAEPNRWKIADINRYEDVRRSEGVMGTTIRREMSLQQAALRHGIKRERLDRAPHFEKPSQVGRVRRALTEDEFQRLMLQPMPFRIRMFFLLAYWTGHRARAIETLTWDRVHFDSRTIDFNEPGARRTNKRRVDGFPIPDALYARLVAAKERHDARCPSDPYVIGLGPRGKPSTTYAECKAALRAIGIDENGICRHTLRKTFVTERIKAGANPEKVALLIGDNAGTMRRHYSVLLAEDLRDTANFKTK